MDSDTAIRATVPAGATSGPVTITTSAGTGASGTDFTVVTLPAISSFTPTNGDIGIEVTIIGSGFEGISDVSSGGISASDFTVDSGSRVRATVPSGASTGMVIVSNAAGSAASADDFVR